MNYRWFPDRGRSLSACRLLNNGARQLKPVIAEKAFVDNWFNVTHNLNITKLDLLQPLEAATMNQLFWFDGDCFTTEIDNVAMGSPPTGFTHSKRISLFYRRETRSRQQDP